MILHILVIVLSWLFFIGVSIIVADIHYERTGTDKPLYFIYSFIGAILWVFFVVYF